MEIIIVQLIWIGTWIGTWWLGWKIMKWKNRWAALIATILLPYVGLIIALLLDQRCPHCWKLASMAADVCPHCGRTIKTGKVDVDMKAVAGVEVKAPPKAKNGVEKVVHDPETHQYVKKLFE